MRFRAEPYDLVVLDVMLPELDGLEVCRVIRRGRRVPILMLSARSDTLDVVVGEASSWRSRSCSSPEARGRSRGRTELSFRSVLFDLRGECAVRGKPIAVQY